MSRLADQERLLTAVVVLPATVSEASPSAWTSARWRRTLGLGAVAGGPDGALAGVGRRTRRPLDERGVCRT